ncbi:MAG: exodeoxyribonuclease VII large subunit [Parahaliea sp.]
MSPNTLSVSQLNRQVRLLLESNFDFIWVEGEISNLKTPSSGHWYFSLKDEAAQVHCAMFRNRNQRMRFKPADGDSIRLRCRVSLYEGKGDFQLIAEYMEAAGVGALQIAFEQLKSRLMTEGLFEANRKQPLPASISRIGLITSPSGAALQDILAVLKRRWPAMAVYILPVSVQGEAAAGEIVTAIKHANRMHRSGQLRLDALIVGRGGGSLEDLWAFNEEVVARAIAASVIPVISAVGHEVDITIADMVADVRAATPSAAAERVSPDQQIWRNQLLQMENRLQQCIQQRLQAAGHRLQQLQQRLRHPGQQLREQNQHLDDLEQRLQRAQQQQLSHRHAELALLSSRLQARSPAPQIEHLQQQLRHQHQRLQAAIYQCLHNASGQLLHLGKLLDSVSPLATLDRGYAIVSTQAGKVLQDASQVKTGDVLNARLAHGYLSLSVLATKAQTESRKKKN